jgi:hypothetical protein
MSIFLILWKVKGSVLEAGAGLVGVLSKEKERFLRY